MIILINAKQYGQLLKKKLFASNNNIILLYSKIMIFCASVPLSDNPSFMFYPTTQANLTLYIHIVNHTINKILVKNISHRPLHILQHQKLSHILDICYKNCFLADFEAIFDFAAFLPIAQVFFDLYARIALILTDFFIKTQLDNNVRIYKDTVTIKEIFQLMTKYPSIWQF